MAEIANIADEIKSRADIADVIGRVVQLRRSGSRMVGLCPFHNEKTPSFFVNSDTQSFICFGCGAKGDVISFYERYYNLNFPEAAEKLAGEYGIDWTLGGYGGDSKRDGYYEVNRAAALYFRNSMRTSGNPARSYMSGRGITDDTMKAFGLGYADGSREGLCAHLKEIGASLESAAEIGLVLREKEGFKDRYYNRVMFPIINTRKKVIGFGGRILGDGNPKYLNSAESKIFLKKNNLYAINITKDEIVKEGLSILVEGYMDVIALFQHGIKNVTASLGTALTDAQARMLKRYAGNVVLAYDADAAGVDAALRGMDILRETGLNVKVLVLEDMKDPDEFVRKHGRAAFAEAVQNAVPFLDFKLKTARKKYDLAEAEGSVAFLREAAGILRTLSPVESDYYVKKLSSETGIAEGAIVMEAWGDRAYGVRRSASDSNDELAVSRRPSFDAGEEDSARDAAMLAIQRNLIRLALYDSAFATEVRPHAKVFVTPSLYRIFGHIASLAAQDPDADTDTKALEELLDDDDRRTLADILDTVLLGEDPARQLRECIAQSEILELSAREKELLDALKVSGSDEARMLSLMEQLKTVQERIYHIKNR
ncbi:MAG: DNA primase [Clostridiales Family XIII bacterium]|nr:DNA primase [Clostridiales Family XIII bacterium]